MLAGLRPEQHVFVCVKSQAFGRLIYPQGKVIPEATGQWTVDSIYGSAGYSYETFVVVTTKAEAAAMLSDRARTKVWAARAATRDRASRHGYSRHT